MLPARVRNAGFWTDAKLSIAGWALIAALALPPAVVVLWVISLNFTE